MLGISFGRRRLLSLLVILSLATLESSVAHQLSDDGGSLIVGCPVTIKDEPPERVAAIEEAIANEVATIKDEVSAFAITNPPLSITVPVNAVILQPADAGLLENPLPTPQNIIDQITAMNTASANIVAIPGYTSTGVDSPTPFQYKLCRPVQTVTNNLWYAASTQSTSNVAATHATATMKQAQRVGGRQTLNMYVKPVWRCEAGAINGALDDCPAGTGRQRDALGRTLNNFAGIATFPWDLNAVSAGYDGVLVHSRQLPGYPIIWDSAPNNGHPGGSHEVGHWQGLLHTFETVAAANANPPSLGGTCTADTPPTFFGDGVADTPPMNNPTRSNQDCVPFLACNTVGDAGCPDTCPLINGADPNYNLMNYLRSRCYREYTVDQATRMEASWNLWRAGNPNNILNVVLPTPVDDSASTPSGTPVNLNVLANDVTALLPGELQVDRIRTPPAVGTAVVAADARTISFTSAPGFTGQVQLMYTIFDCNGVSAAAATVRINVLPSVTCATGRQIVSLPLVPGGTCDDAPFPASAVTVNGNVRYTLEPPGPYAPGNYNVRVTPDNGTPSCNVDLRVAPCAAGCVNRTVPTDPNVCLASNVDIVDRRTVGRTALSTVQAPPAPYRKGTTNPVTVSVVYPGLFISQPSGECSVTVNDVQLPVVTATNVCTYPMGGHKYSTKSFCFDVTQLAVLTDNCPLGTQLTLVNCQLTGPPLSKSLAKTFGAGCSISDDSKKLCVPLARIHPKRPRIFRVTVRGADESGNFAQVDVTVRLNSKRPKVGSNSACLHL